MNCNERIHLESICEKIGSGATPTGGSNAYKETGISLIRSQNVLDYLFDKDGLAFIDEKQARKLNNVEVKVGDILLNITGDSVARVCIVPNEVLPGRVNQHVCIIRINNKVTQKYVFYFLQFIKPILLQMASSGATRKALTKEMICNLELELPSEESQKNIVNILDSLTEKIIINNKLNDNLAELKATLFKAWFIDFIDEKNIINTDSSCIPNGWKMGTFSEIIEETIGGDWGKESPEGNYTEEVYCIRGADIPEVKSGNKGKLPIRYILHRNFINKGLEENDLVIEISGGSPTQSTGRITEISRSLLKRYNKGMICTNFCRAIKPKVGYSSFIYSYWQYLYDKGIMFSYENGTTGIKNLDINSLIENEEIVIPPKDKVDAFNKVICKLNEMIYSNGFENERLSNLRDLLLPKLLSGEIDLENIELDT